MGQTLTHGIYLPDEGERNCYDGLAANWQLLDGAVGTIAEHTSALSGKAPLVHTHTKSDITDFPAYGNAAGTICEGNDSRLSDARTPVAHTHGKADITDLFNSANTWSNYNSYSKGIELAGQRYAYILPEFAANYSGISILTNSFGKSVKFGSYTVDENKVVSLDTTLGFFEIYAGYANDVNTVRINPRNAAVAELGTSNYKWKTLNGINPGALSLPDLNTAQTIDRTGWAYDGSTYNSIKLSSTDTNMTKNGWLYVRISSTGSSDKLSIKYNSIGDKYPTSSFGDTGGCIEVFVPVIAGSSVYLCATKDLQFCKFYPCLGNV